MTRGFLPKKLPQRLVLAAGARPWTVLVIYTLILLASAFMARNITIDSDYLSLVPQENAVVNDFRSTVERFGAIDILLVAMELDQTRDLEDDLAYADIFAETLRDSHHIRWVDYRLADFTSAAETLLDRVTLFMGLSELEEFLSRFSPQGAETAAQTIAQKLNSPLGSAYKPLVLKDPLNAAPLLLKGSGFQAMGSRFHGETGYLIDPDEKLLLMLVKPTHTAADLGFGRQLMTDLAEMETIAADIWRDEEYQGEPPKVMYGGGYPIAVAEGRLITRDLIGGVAGAMIGVVVLFTIAFGRPTAIIISAVPLIFGLIVTFGFVMLTLGRLNAATSTFAALLIGLGVDFIIVLYSRYLEERAAGADHETALTAFGRHTAVGVLLGAATTATTFYAFLISDFKGLSELGLLTGTGILLLVLTVFMLLPALLTLFEKNRASQRFELRAFGLDSLVTISCRHRRKVLAAALLITPALAMFIPRVYYEDDVLSMRSPQNPGVIAQNRIMDSFGIRFTPMMIRVDAQNETELFEKTHILLEQINQLSDDQIPARIDSLLSLLPSGEQQAAVLARLETFELDERAFKQDFAAALEGRNLNPAPFMQGLEPMLAAVGVSQPLSLAQLATPPLDRLLNRYAAYSDGDLSTVIYCYPPAGKWRREMPPQLMRLVDQHPEATLTGPVAISIELKKIVWHDARIAMAAGTLIVLMFLIWDLGSIAAGLFAMIPLALGMVWTIGAMGLFNLPVNFMNIFVFTMIIGIGVDYGIHLIHRMQENGTSNLRGTGKAVVIAALTTVIGFGSLVASHYPGLRTMGLVAIFGATSTALISITILPALLSWREDRK